MEMTKEKLLEYNNLVKEIKDLERRIKNVEKQSEMVSDVVQNGVKGRAFIYGVDVKRKFKLEKYKRKLNDFRTRLAEESLEVEEFIQNIPSSVLRIIFRLRYLDGLQWFQIADKLGYNSETAPRKKHDRFLEKNL